MCGRHDVMHSAAAKIGMHMGHDVTCARQQEMPDIPRPARDAGYLTTRVGWSNHEDTVRPDAVNARCGNKRESSRDLMNTRNEPFWAILGSAMAGKLRYW